MWINVWFFIHIYIYLWFKLGSGSSIVFRTYGDTAAFVSLTNDWQRGSKAVGTKLHSALCAMMTHFTLVFFYLTGTRKSCENLWGVRGTRHEPCYTECLCVFKRVIYPAPLKKVEECSMQTAEVSSVNEMGSKWRERREVMAINQWDQ